MERIIRAGGKGFKESQIYLACAVEKRAPLGQQQGLVYARLPIAGINGKCRSCGTSNPSRVMTETDLGYNLLLVCNLCGEIMRPFTK